MTTTDDTTTAAAAAADRFDVCLSSMGTALAAASDLPAWTLSEAAVQDRLRQALVVRAGVEELTTRLLASVVDREVPRLAGASSTRAWLMATAGMSAIDAARLVTESRLHDDDPSTSRTEPTRAAWAAGQVKAEQAVLIGRTIDKLSPDLPERAVQALQVDLVGHAQRLGWRQLQTVCRHALEVVDPDGADAALAAQLQTEEERASRLCELSFRRSGDGWTGFHGRLPDAQADLWRNILESLTAPRHEHAVSPSAGDTVAGDGRHHDRGVGAGEAAGPPYPQRLGRALLELLEHLPTDRFPQHGVNPATLMVTITLDQLKTGLGEAMLDTGTAMSPGQCRRLACNATLVPVVLGADSAILDLGLSRRLFDRFQRLALAIRDGGCIWPGCERPPAWCEAHHITAWTDGGPTDLANGCLLCPFHHHLIHSTAGWHIRMAPDGVPDLIPPQRLDPHRQPRRHQRLQRLRC